MKIRFNTASSRVRVISLLAMAATLFALGREGAQAYSDPVRASGMIGITREQTARINVVNTADNPDLMPVSVEMTFLDGRGDVLKQAVETIGAGRSVYLDLSGEDVTSEGRAMIRAAVRFEDNPDPRTLSGIIVTLEVFDSATGKTTSGWSVPEPPENPAPQL